MIKTLNMPSSEFSLTEILLCICKKPTSSSVSQPEIDYLLLEKQVEQLQQVQLKTCQQIVQFVDENREELISISEKFNNIGSTIQKSSLVLANLKIKIDDYKTAYYQEESKIQQYINEYEESLIEDEIIHRVKDELQFLIQFVMDFQHFINRNVQDLSHRNKHNILKLIKKQQYLKGIFEHPMAKKVLPSELMLFTTLQNTLQQMQFYLEEQLSSIISNKSRRSKKINGHTQLDELFIWYKLMKKQNHFYEAVERKLITRQLSSLEEILISNKHTLNSKKQQNILGNFFTQLFMLIEEFPLEKQYRYPYPEERILSLLYNFLNKKEVSFMYKFAMPIFYVSYGAYMSAVENIKNQNIKNQLKNRHNWNLTIWADFRTKNIFFRIGRQQGGKSLSFWVGNVLKKNCMIQGVKSYMVKLIFQLINRYCGKLQEKGVEFSVENANMAVKEISEVREILSKKMMEAYQSKDELEKMKNEQTIGKMVHLVDNLLNRSTKKWFIDHMDAIISPCKRSLENKKNFVFCIINKSDKQTINKKSVLFKPFETYIKNNPEIQTQTVKFMHRILFDQLIQYYDEGYTGDIYKYCNSNLTEDQTKKVMERIIVEKEDLFGSKE